MPDAVSRERLAAMGIEIWVRRERPRSASLAAAESPSITVAADPASVRIRLASGDGEWLLVKKEAWSGEHRQLVDDLVATLGPGRCRFGQWSVSESAGVLPDELDSRGVRHVLALGAIPRAVEHPLFVAAPSLDELSASPEARRLLWQLLEPLLQS